MKTIRAIIVDDEKDARDVLESLLEMSSFSVDIAEKCSNVTAAVDAIKRHKPDIVFLDVRMPNHNGFELINFFDEIDFKIVFVTAFDEYARKAFEISAVDYLVKPIERKRLDQALSKLVNRIELENSATEYQLLLNETNSDDYKIIIPELNGKRVLSAKDIVCLQGKGSYTTLHLVDQKKLLVSKNLKYLESLLSNDDAFFRAQKSWVVNLNYIESFNASGSIFLSHNVEAKLSKNRIEDFYSALKLYQ